MQEAGILILENFQNEHQRSETTEGEAERRLPAMYLHLQADQARIPDVSLVSLVNMLFALDSFMQVRKSSPCTKA